jgi:DNA gyrase/topoisomerase IV, subunit A
MHDLVIRKHSINLPFRLSSFLTGQSIEPTCYVPVIPMALVNGSDGIGTGKTVNSFRFIYQ